MKDKAEIESAYTSALWEHCIRIEEKQNVRFLCDELKGRVYALGWVLDKTNPEMDADLKLSSKEIATKYGLD